MKSEKFLLFLMLISMCIWGMSWSSAKVLSGYGSASSITYIRFVLVPLTLFPLLKLAKIPVAISKKGLPAVLVAGALMTFYTILFFNGLQRGMPGAGGVLVTVSIPIFTYVISLVLTRKLPNKNALAGLTVGAIGGSILLNIWEDYANLLAAGNSFFLVASLVWAILAKITSGSQKFGSPISFNFWLHLISVIVLSFLADFSEIINILQNGDQKFWLNIFYFAVINSSLATTTYFYATTKLGAEKASSFIFIVPSAAVTCSWLFLDEAIEIRTIIGGLLGLLAVFVINKAAKKTTL